MSGITFEHALSYAAWYTRTALDLAPDQPDLHAGVLPHLKGGLVQLDAAERLQATPTPIREAA